MGTRLSGFGLLTLFSKRGAVTLLLWLMITHIVPCPYENQTKHQKENEYQGVFQESQF